MGKKSNNASAIKLGDVTHYPFSLLPTAITEQGRRSILNRSTRGQFPAPVWLLGAPYWAGPAVLEWLEECANGPPSLPVKSEV